MIITPGQLNRRAELYHQIGIMITAGITIRQALEHLNRNPPERAMRAPISQLIEYLDQGCTVTDAVLKMGAWMPSFDAALIEAGDRSGRMDACFKLLALYYRERAQLVRQVISDMMYPAFVLHFAIVLFPFLDYFMHNGSVIRLLTLTLIPLGLLYGATFFIIIACQGRRGEKWRSKVEEVIRRIPMLGVARKHLALARLAAALEALFNAGVLPIGAWNLAATASGSPALRRVVANWKIPLETGSTPAELLSRSDEFPEMFANLYHTGEISGKLDESLLRLHAFYQEEGSRKMHTFAQWTPRAVYMLVALLVGWKVISFYTGYFDMVDKASKF
ncbi:MAG TPA: type II secretion system F family protein [Candidatus Saccharimonadales bacterium]|nr:type II secretion system F family protein [Candidatus Saccharimonadales bacterium]